MLTERAITGESTRFTERATISERAIEREQANGYEGTNTQQRAMPSGNHKSERAIE